MTWPSLEAEALPPEPSPCWCTRCPAAGSRRLGTGWPGAQSEGTCRSGRLGPWSWPTGLGGAGGQMRGRGRQLTVAVEDTAVPGDAGGGSGATEGGARSRPTWGAAETPSGLLAPGLSGVLAAPATTVQVVADVGRGAAGWRAGLVGPRSCPSVASCPALPAWPRSCSGAGSLHRRRCPASQGPRCSPPEGWCLGSGLLRAGVSVWEGLSTPRRPGHPLISAQVPHRLRGQVLGAPTRCCAT